MCQCPSKQNMPLQQSGIIPIILYYNQSLRTFQKALINVTNKQDNCSHSTDEEIDVHKGQETGPKLK